MESSGERLKKLIESKGVTQKDLAEYLGVTIQYVSNLCNNRAVIGKVQAERIANYFGVPASYVVFGGAIEPVAERADVSIPVINMFALGGSLTEQLEAVNVTELPRIQSPVVGAEMAIEVSGDSMEPEYPSGSRLFCRRISEPTFIEWGRVYVVDTTAGAIVKELQPGDNDDLVKCVSLNCDKNYQPFNVPKSSIRGIWKILGVFILK